MGGQNKWVGGMNGLVEGMGGYNEWVGIMNGWVE